MDLSVIYAKTPKGARLRKSLFGGLSAQLMKILALVDGKATAQEMLAQLDGLAAQKLILALTQIEKEGYIKRVEATATDDDWALDTFFSPMIVEEVDSIEEIDGKAELETFLELEAIAKAKEAHRREDERKAREIEAQIRAKEKAKAEAEARAQAELVARWEAERQEKAEHEAGEKAALAAQEQAEKIRVRLEIEAKAKAEAEAQAQARMESERIAREAEEKQKMAEVNARQKAELEAQALVERIRVKEKARREALRIAREAKEVQEAQKKAEDEARIEAEIAAREASEIMRIKAEAEAKALAEDEEKARIEAERIARAAEEAQKLIEAEAYAKAEEQTRLAAEQQATEAAEAREQAALQARQEAEEARIEAELAAQAAQAKEEARLEGERQAKQAAEAREKAEQEASIEAERLRALAEAEAQAQLAAQENARLEAERIAREAEEVRMKAEAEAHAKKIEEARLAAEHQAQLEAEALAQVKAQAKEQARLEKERLAKLKAEAAAQSKAEAKARKEAERIAKKEKSAALAQQKSEQKAAEKEAREEAKRLASELMGEKPLCKKYGVTDIAKAKIRKFNITVLSRFKSTEPSKVNTKKWFSGTFKLILVYVPILLLLLVGLMHVVPLNMLVKPIENLATESIGAPVAVDEVRASLLPQPHLVLNHVVIGEHSALSIEAAHVTVAISSLLDEDKIVESLVIEGVELAPKDFSLPLQWINQASKAEQVKIEQISFKKVNLKIRELELATFNGKAELNALRQLNSIVLTSIDHVLSVEITPQIGQFNLKLTADHWPLPLNPKIVFEELKASGTCNQEGIKFNQVHGSIYGGQFTANTVLNWSDAWAASGNYNLTKANTAQILKTFASTGSVDGKLSLVGQFTGQSTEAAKFMDDAELTANFEIPSGKINGVDLPRAMMSSEDKSLEGYATNFDKLTGNVRVKNGRYQYRNLVLRTPNMQAQGQFEIDPNQAISGKIYANLSAKARSFQSTFDLTGKVSNVKRQ